MPTKREIAASDELLRNDELRATLGNTIFSIRTLRKNANGIVWILKTLGFADAILLLMAVENADVVSIIALADTTISQH